MLTAESETKIISDKIAPKSQKYDYLLEKAQIIFSFEKFRKEKTCIGFSEKFKIYKRDIIFSIVAASAAFVIANVNLHLDPKTL
ncbi:MAG TPA: hypothetical protein VH415_02575 [Nitrososphaeraceae archaeon]|jgi:hypothetical protein